MQKLFILLTIMTLILISCGKQENPPIMKVGDQSLSRDVLLDRFNSSPLKNRVDNLTVPELKNFIEQQFLEAKLYLAEGYAMKLDQDSTLKTQLDQAEKEVLLKQNGLLFKAVVPKDFSAADAEIQELYSHLDKELKIAYILLQSKSLADSLYQLLQKGADFAELAKKYSTDLKTGPQGGVVNNYIIGGLPDAELENTLFSLAKNEFSAPINSMYGYQIIKVLDIRPIDRKPLAEIKDEIADRIKNRKLNIFLKQYFDELPGKYNFKINETAVSAILKAYQMQDGKPGIQKSSLDASILNQTVAESQVGDWTVDKFITQYEQNATPLQLQLKTARDVEEFIKASINTDLMLAEANRLKLKESPEFFKELALTRERIIQMKSQELLIAPKINVTDAEIAAYQEAHKKEYEKEPPERARLQISNILRQQKIQRVKEANFTVLKEKHKVVYNEEALEDFLNDVKKEN